MGELLRGRWAALQLLAGQLMHYGGSTHGDELRLSSDDDPRCGRAVNEVFRERVTGGSSSLPPAKAEQSSPLNHICGFGSIIDKLTVAYSTASAN